MVFIYIIHLQDLFRSKQFVSKLGPEMLVERRNIFHNSLLQLVKDQHRQFLVSNRVQGNSNNKKEER